MPVLPCNADVLVATLGSVDGMRHHLSRLGASQIVSVDGNDVEHTIVADHPQSRVTVHTLTTPSPPATRVVITSRPHTPFVAGGFVRIEHIVSSEGPKAKLVSKYEVGWDKKPPVLPLQRKIQAKLEENVTEELKNTYKFLKTFFKMEHREISLWDFVADYRRWKQKSYMMYEKSYEITIKFKNGTEGTQTIEPPVNLSVWKDAILNPTGENHPFQYFALSMWVHLDNRKHSKNPRTTPIDKIAASMLCTHRDTTANLSQLGKKLINTHFNETAIERVKRKMKPNKFKPDTKYFEQVATKIIETILEILSSQKRFPEEFKSVKVKISTEACNYDFHNLYQFIPKETLVDLCITNFPRDDKHLNANRAANSLVKVATPYLKMFEQAVNFLKYLYASTVSDYRAIFFEVDPMLKTLYNVAKAALFFYEDDHTVSLCISWPNLKNQAVPFNEDQQPGHGSKEQPLIAQVFDIQLCSEDDGDGTRPATRFEDAGGGAVFAAGLEGGGGGTRPAAVETPKVELTVRIGTFVPLKKMPVAVYIPLDLDYMDEWQNFFSVVDLLILRFEKYCGNVDPEEKNTDELKKSLEGVHLLFQRKIAQFSLTGKNQNVDDDLKKLSEKYSLLIAQILNKKNPRIVFCEILAAAEFLMSCSGFSEYAKDRTEGTLITGCLKKLSYLVEKIEIFYPPLLREEFKRAYNIIDGQDILENGQWVKSFVMERVVKIKTCVDIIETRQTEIKQQAKWAQAGDQVLFHAMGKIFSRGPSLKAPTAKREAAATKMFYIHETVVTGTRPRRGKETFEVVLQDPLPACFKHSVLAGMRIVVDRDEVEEYLNTIRSLLGASQREKERIAQLLDEPQRYNKLKDENIISWSVFDFWISHSDFVSENVVIETFEGGRVKTKEFTKEFFSENAEYLARPTPIINDSWAALPNVILPLAAALNMYNKNDDKEFAPESTREKKFSILLKKALDYLDPYIKKLGLTPHNPLPGEKETPEKRLERDKKVLTDLQKFFDASSEVAEAQAADLADDETTLEAAEAVGDVKPGTSRRQTELDRQKLQEIEQLQGTKPDEYRLSQKRLAKSFLDEEAGESGGSGDDDEAGESGGSGDDDDAPETEDDDEASGSSDEDVASKKPKYEGITPFNKMDLLQARESYFLSALWANVGNLYGVEGPFDIDDIKTQNAKGIPAAFPTHVELLYFWMKRGPSGDGGKPTTREEERYMLKVDAMFSLLQKVSTKYSSGDEVLTYESKVYNLAKEMYPNDKMEQAVEHVIGELSDTILSKRVGTAPPEKGMLMFEPTLLEILSKCQKQSRKDLNFQMISLVRDCNGGFQDLRSVSFPLPPNYTNDLRVTKISNITSFEDLKIEFEGVEDKFGFNVKLIQNPSFLAMMKTISKKKFKNDFWAFWRRLCIFPHIEVDPRHGNMAIEFVEDVIEVFELVPQPSLTGKKFTEDSFKETAKQLVVRWNGIFDHDSIFQATCRVIEHYIQFMSGETKSYNVNPEAKRSRSPDSSPTGVGGGTRIRLGGAYIYDHSIAVI